MKTPILYTALLFLAVLDTAHARVAMPANISSSSSLQFIENKGQIIDQHGNKSVDVNFKLEAPGMNVFVGKGQIHYQWNRSLNQDSQDSGITRIKDDINSDAVGTKSPSRGFRGEIETYRLDVTLIDANPNSQLIAEDKTGYYENYYLPQCPGGITAHSYKKVIYKNVYPHIDWILYINQGSLKYDFVVHGGGDVKDIQLRYDGATSLSIIDGALVTTTPYGTITEKAPYTYDGATLAMVESSFVLENNVLRFKIPGSSALVIDPVLEWATYYGGVYGEEGWTVKTDNIDNVYMAGETYSANNIATSGSHQVSLLGSQDGFVVKFNPGGARLWATYCGGSDMDEIYCIAIDGGNNVYAAGWTHSSSGVATAGSFKDSLDNWEDGFLVKFNNSGQRVWATYYGGESTSDRITCITADKNNYIYIGGHTGSKNKIATPGCHQDSLQYHVQYYLDGFFAKFDTSGARLWGTYYGGGLSDWINAIETDRFNDIYIGGKTMSVDNIATPGSHKSSNYPSNFMGFLAKFNSNGVRQWGTYYGDETNRTKDFQTSIDAIAVSDSGEIYVAGETSDLTGISSAGAFQELRDTSYGLVDLSNGNLYALWTDAFIAKFDIAGTKNWGSYFGGPEYDYFEGIEIDGWGDICLVGHTRSSNMATSGAWKMNYSGQHDGVFVKFDKYGQRLWATYVGDNKGDFLTGIAIDHYSNAYLCGRTMSSSGIATSGAYQPTLGGSSDAVLVKATPDSTIYIAQPFTDTVLCTGINLQVGYITSRSFNPGNIFTVQLSDINGNFANAVNIGTKVATGSGFVSCVIPASISMGKGYRIRILSSLPALISANNGIDIEMIQKPAKPTVSSNSPVCPGETLTLNATCVTPGVSYYWRGPHNFKSSGFSAIVAGFSAYDSGYYVATVSPFVCGSKDSVFATVKPVPGIPVITHNAPICEGDSLKLNCNTTAGANYEWRSPDNIMMTGVGKAIIASRGSQGIWKVTAELNNCTSADSTYVEVKPKPHIKASSNSPVWAGEQLNLFVSCDLPGVSFIWTGPLGFSSSEQNPVLINVSDSNKGWYFVVATLNGCAASEMTLVSVKPKIQDVIKPVFILYPNPNNGEFIISGRNLATNGRIFFEILNVIGQAICSDHVDVIGGSFDKTIKMAASAAGVYNVRFFADGRVVNIPYILSFEP